MRPTRGESTMSLTNKNKMSRTGMSGAPKKDSHRNLASLHKSNLSQSQSPSRQQTSQLSGANSVTAGVKEKSINLNVLQIEPSPERGAGLSHRSTNSEIK